MVTLFQENKKHHNRKAGSKETPNLGPYWKLATSYLHGKYGVESLKRDNTQSWDRISHGLNKFVIESNNNDTEIPSDLLEEQALQLKVKDFACRSKAKAKPQRREPVDYSPSIVPGERRNWIEIEAGNPNLSYRRK